MENYSLHELVSEFEKLTVEALKDVLLVDAQDINIENTQQLMHQTILFVNHIGGPEGSALSSLIGRFL